MGWALFDSLAEDAQRRVIAQSRRRSFRRGEVVFHEGDPGNTMHLVQRGHFAVRITTPLGDIATLRVHGPGGYFGELALLSPGPRSATVIALSPGETLSLSEGSVSELRRSDPAVEEAFLEAMIAEVRRLSGALVEALYIPADKRIHRRLLDLARAFEVTDGFATIPLTQEELAQLAGTTRPTANRVVRALEKEGAVAVSRGRIDIHDVAALERRAR